MSQQSGCVQRNRHVGQFELSGLEIGQVLAEHLPILGEVQRRLISRLAHADSCRRHGGAERIEGAQRQTQPPAPFSQQVGLRYVAVNPAGFADRMGRHQVHAPRVVEARHSSLNDKAG